MNVLKTLSKAISLALVLAFPVIAQSVQVKAGKEMTAIPKACELIVPAGTEGHVDIKALVKESYCKGSGDALAEYTYTLKSLRRQKTTGGQIKEETRVYEVFMPALPSGARGRGVLLITSRDGVPVPPAQLERDRLRAGERLEREEKTAASTPVSQARTTANLNQGMLPLGTYGKFGFGEDKVVVKVHTFLEKCDFTLIRRDQNGDREMLVFTFTPQPDAQFKDNEKYITQLKGAIWIDAKDRIVTRLVGWPRNEEFKNEQDFATQLTEQPPAVFVEMMRLPTGVWLPFVTGINGADYPKLFDRIVHYSTLTFSEYKRFTTEIKDLSVGTPPSAR